jgi:hypothetical protein
MTPNGANKNLFLSFKYFGPEQVTSWPEDDVHLIPFDVSLHLNGKIVKAIFREP